MKGLFRRFGHFIRWTTAHPGLVLIIACCLTVIGLLGTTQLRIDTDFSNLIPSDYPSVQALEKLRETVGSESEAAVAIVSPSFNANRSFAESFIAEALQLEQQDGQRFLTRVEYRRDTEFLENNALYFATPEELSRVEGELQSRIEEAKLEANPFYFDLDEEEEEQSAEDVESLDDLYDRIVGKEYPVSDDSTTLVLQFYPGGSQTNIGYIEDLYAALDSLVADLNPSSFHPDMEVVVAGRLLRQLVEVDAIRGDILGSFGVGMMAVLLLVTLYFAYKSYTARVGHIFSVRGVAAELFRMPVMALLIGIPLFMSLCWTFGTAYFVVGSLNLMTATLGLVLFGLGIDYGIHFYARYAEERAVGASLEDAIETTFLSTGQAVMVGALTTAVALYALMIADFKGFSEFGFIAGTGVLFAVASMLVVLPAMMAIFERIGVLDLTTVSIHKKRQTGIFRGHRIILAASLLLVVASIASFPPEFEYRFGELEPEYTEYNQKREVIRRVFEGGSRRNPAYVVVETPEAASQVAEWVRNVMVADTVSPTVHSVENLHERFPLTDEGKQTRLERIDEIRQLLDEPALQAQESTDVDRLRRAAGTTVALSLEQVPPFLRDQFTSKDGSLGNFVIIYPSVGLSDGRLSIAFSNDVGTITLDSGEVFHAGSTSLVAADMLKLMRAEAPWMIGITFVVVILLMWANFGSLRWGALALVPLVVGVLWMILVMELLGLRLNFYNLIVLPAILGIGNDAGVHLVHRYREEGRGSIVRVLRSTGEHITMGTLTTMIGFAGPLLSFHPGLNTIGSLAVAGLATTLVATLVFLPALLKEMERDNPEPGPSSRTPQDLSTPERTAST